MRRGHFGGWKRMFLSTCPGFLAFPWWGCAVKEQLCPQFPGPQSSPRAALLPPGPMGGSRLPCHTIFMHQQDATGISQSQISSCNLSHSSERPLWKIGVERQAALWTL